MSPKNLLRHRLCVSSLGDMGEGTRFLRTIGESGEGLVDPREVRRHVFCSGKVYYDLVQARDKAAKDSGKPADVAITRIEQIAPFPFDKVRHHAERFPNAEIIWCQEEPKNCGAWNYVRPRIATSLRESTAVGKEATYVGRGPAAAVSTGYAHVHALEQAQLVEQALA